MAGQQLPATLLILQLRGFMGMHDLKEVWLKSAHRTRLRLFTTRSGFAAPQMRLTSRYLFDRGRCRTVLIRDDLT